MNKEELVRMEVLFTEESFVIDDMNEDNEAYALYKSDKYHFLYELGFLHDMPTLSPGMQFLVELSSRFFHKLSRMPELEVAREDTKVQFESDEADELIGRVPYVIGARLDENPFLFFELRGIDAERLIDIAIKDHVEVMLEHANLPLSDRVMDDSVIETLFGL